MNKNNCSVIMTGKNCEKTISDSLLSICKQDNINEIDFVFIDDGSDDGTSELVVNYPYPSHVKLNYAYFEVGRAKALNMAVDRAKFDRIAILDADDMFHPLKLSIQIEAMNENKEYCLLATDFRVGEHTDEGFYIGIEPNYPIIDVTLKRLITGNPFCHSSVMIDKKYAKYDERRNKQIDLKLWLELADLNLKLGVVKSPLTFKRIHKDQSFESKNRYVYILSSYFLTMSYARPFYKYFYQILIRTMKLTFHLLPRNISTLIKRFIRR